MSVKQLAITVSPESDSVATVRHFVEFAQRMLGPLADPDAVAVLTSELVANAVDVGAGEITVTILAVDDRLRVEVRDHGFGLPELRHPAPFDSGGGRGLMIVDHLADAWGVQQFLPGKIVWFEIGPALAFDQRESMRG